MSAAAKAAAIAAAVAAALTTAVAATTTWRLQSTSRVSAGVGLLGMQQTAAMAINSLHHLAKLHPAALHVSSDLVSMAQLHQPPTLWRCLQG